MRLDMLMSVTLLSLLWAPPVLASPKLTVLQDLTEQTGGGPEFPPIIGQDGNLYGTTYTSNNGGGIYSVGTNGKNFAVLYMFPGGAAGDGPYGGLVQGSNGQFYGTTLFGGVSGQGTVFQFDAASRSVTLLHSFDVADGSTPYAGVVVDSSGNMYGTTSGGGANNLGTVYKIAAGTGAFTKLADFDSKADGTPFSPLAIGRDGMLYGTATGAETGTDGAIFRLSPQGGKIEVLHTFSGQDGAGPFSGLTVGRGGILYGTTDFGGAQRIGVLFAFDVKGRKLSILHSFVTSDGAGPQGQIALDRSGRLLGTTFYDGANNAGTIYRYDPSLLSFTVLENLFSSEAGSPNAGFTYAGGKIFFGGTLSGAGGESAAGTVIKFSE